VRLNESIVIDSNTAPTTEILPISSTTSTIEIRTSAISMSSSSSTSSCAATSGDTAVTRGLTLTLGEMDESASEVAEDTDWTINYSTGNYSDVLTGNLRNMLAMFRVPLLEISQSLTRHDSESAVHISTREGFTLSYSAPVVTNQAFDRSRYGAIQHGNVRGSKHSSSTRKIARTLRVDADPTTDQVLEDHAYRDDHVGHKKSRKEYSDLQKDVLVSLLRKSNEELTRLRLKKTNGELDWGLICLHPDIDAAFGESYHKRELKNLFNYNRNRLVSSHIGSPVPAISTASSQQDIRNLIPTTSHSAIQASASHTQGLNAPTTTTSFIPQQQVHVVAVDNTSQGNGEETMDIDEDGSQSTNANTLNVYSATSGTEENSGLTLSPPPKFVFTINSVHSVNEIVSLQLPEPTSGYSIDEIDLLEGVYQHFQASCKSGTNINWKALTSKYWYYAKRFSLEHPNRFKIFNREEGAFLAWAKKKIGNLKKIINTNYHLITMSCYHILLQLQIR